ncbi:MAG: endo-1,4-beta-xylanase [Candidatus Caenarcaniphilales bacterium]|nr:endo-1,4-beta-xylanase [Candidatus Caenarcaniphilales bacterium]
MNRRSFLKYSAGVLGLMAFFETADCKSEVLASLKGTNSFSAIKGIEVLAAIPIGYLDPFYESDISEHTIIRARRFLEKLDGLRMENQTKSNRLFQSRNNSFVSTCNFIDRFNELSNKNYKIAAHALLWDHNGVISESEPRMKEIKYNGTREEKRKFILDYVFKALKKVTECESVKSIDILNEILVLHGEEIPFGHKGIPIRGFDNGKGLIPDIETIALVYKKATERYPKIEFILNLVNTLPKDHKGASRKRKYVIKTLKKFKELMGTSKLPTIGLQAHFIMSVEEALLQLDSSIISGFISQVHELGFEVEISEFDFLSNSLDKSLRFINAFFNTLRGTRIRRFCFWHFETPSRGWIKEKLEKVYGAGARNKALPGDISNDLRYRHLRGTAAEFTMRNPLYKAYFEGLLSSQLGV